ncbi:DUF2268 domain-containing protein [Robiginitalea sp.]|nr:DUF2268 domain-containing protein [Robiginitalea sp.]
MNILKILILVLSFSIISCESRNHQSKGRLIFNEEKIEISRDQKEWIRDIIIETEIEVKTLLPALPDSINVIIEFVDWNLDAVNGVVGRTESNNPPLVAIQISKNYSNGVLDSLKSGIRSTIFHEYHHVSRGWAIKDNKYGRGIPNAMVNEGLAVVFSEYYTGNMQKVNSYDDRASKWVKEIMDLPINASYSDWVMGEHPDGRKYIAYRTGNFLIKRAINLTGKSVLELSDLSPKEIINLAGY